MPVSMRGSPVHMSPTFARAPPPPPLPTANRVLFTNQATPRSSRPPRRPPSGPEDARSRASSTHTSPSTSVDPVRHRRGSSSRGPDASLGTAGGTPKFVRISMPGSRLNGASGLLLTEPVSWKLPECGEGEVYVMFESTYTVAVHPSYLTPVKSVRQAVTGLDEHKVETDLFAAFSGSEPHNDRSYTWTHGKHFNNKITFGHENSNAIKDAWKAQSRADNLVVRRPSSAGSSASGSRPGSRRGSVS